MTSERYVLLGLAQVRSAWFRDVARWATAAALPIEFVKAMSLEEVRVRLRSGRGFSALLIDDSIAGLDRDIVDLARDAGCAVLLVDSGRAAHGASTLGASGVLPHGFGHADLLHVLGQVATTVTRLDGPAVATTEEVPAAGYRGRLVAVCGPGGAGSSTVAMALAQGLAADSRHADLVCLADLALHADQAMLHDALDVTPGITELVGAHRGGTPTVDAIRALTWRVEARGYHLLLGLRRHREWTTIRPRAFEAALDGLRRGFRAVVADIDDDLEGEQVTGSIDIEERNVMARAATRAADIVVVVGGPGLRGVHALLRCTRELLEHGVASDRLLPVVNRAPRSPRARAELTSAYTELLRAYPGGEGVPSPIHLAERRHLDELVRDGAPLPAPWLAPLCTAALAAMEHHRTRPPSVRVEAEPVPVAPGSLGAWTDEGDDG